MQNKINIVEAFKILLEGGYITKHAASKRIPLYTIHTHDIEFPPDKSSGCITDMLFHELCDKGLIEASTETYFDRHGVACHYYKLSEKYSNHINTENTGLSHIARFEVAKHVGSYQVDKVVLFNQNHVSEEEALCLVKAGGHNDHVLALPKTQWVALFKDGKA